MIQEDILTVLSASLPISAIVGTKIYPMRLPRDTDVPAVVYKMPNIEPESTLSGDSGTDRNDLEIKCWSSKYFEAHTLAYAVRNTLKNSSLKVVPISHGDEEDKDTLNFCVLMNFRIFSEPT